MARKLAGILLALILSAAATVTAVMLLNDKDDNGGTEAGTTQSGTTTGGSGSSGSSGGNTNQSGSSGSQGGSSSGGSSSGSTGSGGSAAQHKCEYVYKSTVEAGCFTQGYKLYECKVEGCGKTEKREFINPHESHDYAWTEITEATCTEDGEKSGICSRCGDTTTDVIDSPGHSYGDYEPASAATCSADATQKAECKLCGYVNTKTVPNTMLEHTYGEYKRNYDSTCTEYGTKTAYCKSCGKENKIKDEASAPGHRYGYWYDKVAATCSTEGKRARKCSLCGDEDTLSMGYGYHRVSGNSCSLCGANVQKGSGIFEASPKTSEGAGNFGNVRIEFEVLSVNGLNNIDYKMYIYKPYADNGNPDGKRYEVAVTKRDNTGTYEFTLWSATDNQAVKFTGGLDISHYEDDRCIKFVIWFSGSAGGNNYCYTGDKNTDCCYVYY